MARKQDWVDYANLASNVIQNVQLSSINVKMQELAELTRRKEDREQERDAEERREAIVRDAVFQADSLLRSLPRISGENPRAAMAWARHTLLQFERNGVTSASFRSYEDKERLRSVIDGHERIVQQCAASLSPQQQDQAERCGQYLAERDDLNLLIRLAGGQEEQERIADRLREINKQEKSQQGLVSALVFAGAIIGFISLVALTVSWLAVIPLVVGAAAIVAAVGMLLRVKQGKNEIQVQSAQLLKDLPLLDPAFGVLPKLRESFGSADSATLSGIQRDRVALIAEVLKNPKPDVAERPSASSDANR